MKISKLFSIFKFYKNWILVILDRLNLINLQTVRLRNGLKFNLLGKGSISCLLETIEKKRYTLFRDIKKDDIVIDIGAYIGDFSAYASHKGANVYAYEPIKESYEKLIENTKLNNLYIKTFNECVWVKSGKCKINKHELLEVSSLVEADKINLQSKKTGIINVSSINISDILKNNNLKYIDFLKIDTEGSEFDILISTPKYILRKINYIAMESTDYQNTNIKNVKLLNHLVESGFKVEIVSSNNTINVIKIYAWRN